MSGKRKPPSERLEGLRKTDTSQTVTIAGDAPVANKIGETLVVRLTPVRRPHKVRTKWRVTENRAVPEFHHGALREVYYITLVAVYEGKPLHGGLAYVQGCTDNLVFGDEEPQAEQRLRIVSKATADIYRFGAIFVQDHVEQLPIG